MERLNFSKISFDSTNFIYLIERNAEFFQIERSIFTKLSDQKVNIILSAIIYAEILVKPFKTNNQRTINVYLDLFKKLPYSRFINVTPEISINAAKLRGLYNLKTPDSIHLATAISEKSEYFITSDKQILKLKELDSMLILNPKAFNNLLKI